MFSMALLVVLFSGDTSFSAGALIPLAIFGYLVWHTWRYSWHFVHEVYDGGDHLLVRKGELEQKIPFSDIDNIRFVRSAHSVVVECRKPGPLGTTIMFPPPHRMNALWHPLQDLFERVERARKGQ